jgi:serine-type D-Ala-D-Ala carboxypeptidase/endopeptidase
MYGKTYFGEGMTSFRLLIGATCLAMSAVFAQTSELVPTAEAKISDVASVAEIQAILDKRVADRRGKGIAVALLLPNGETRFVSAGDSGNAARSKVDEDTIFEIASITKTFTATLLAQMIERGEVSLNDPVRRFAPAGVQMISPGVGDVTLEQLSTHTSGMPRLPPNWQFIKWRYLDYSNPYAHYSKEILWANAATEKLDSTKKYPSQYSNYGVGLLGDALGNRLQTNWPALVRERITAPLGMKATDVTTDASHLAHLAYGVEGNFNRVRHWDSPGLGAAGALRSSARDMSFYIRAQRDGTLAGARATHVVRAKMDGNNTIGLGWIVTKNFDDSIVWHNGGTAGFSSFIGFSQKSGIGVVVLANQQASVDDIGLHIINSKYQPSEKLPNHWIGIVICAFALAWLVVTTWFARLGPSIVDGIAVPKRRFGPLPMSSKEQVAWWLVSAVMTMILVHLLAPWQVMSEFGRWLVWGAVIVSVAALIWRARHLPWRDHAGIAAQSGTTRMKKRISFIFGGGLSLLILAFILWNAMQP